MAGRELNRQIGQGHAMPGGDLRQPPGLCKHMDGGRGVVEAGILTGLVAGQQSRVVRRGSEYGDATVTALVHEPLAAAVG
jgi:hypothetical protein